MGNLHAQEFAGVVGEGELKLEQAIGWHLSANHYPPIDKAFIPVALEAIELANGDEWATKLEYPNGLIRTVAYTIEGLHLEAFLDEE